MLPNSTAISWIPSLRLVSGQGSGRCLPVWVWRIVYLRSSNPCRFSAAPFRALATPSMWSLLLPSSTAVSYGARAPTRLARGLAGATPTFGSYSWTSTTVSQSREILAHPSAINKALYIAAARLVLALAEHLASLSWIALRPRAHASRPQLRSVSSPSPWPRPSA